MMYDVVAFAFKLVNINIHRKQIIYVLESLSLLWNRGADRLQVQTVHLSLSTAHSHDSDRFFNPKGDWNSPAQYI